MTSRANEVEDRRIRRTRQALRAALISLLTERGWDDVRVQDICVKADVGRSTFYMHFQSKEELLSDGLEGLRSMLLEQARKARKTQTTTFPFVRGLMEHVHEERALFRSLIGRGSGHVVQMRFRKMISLLVEEELAHLTPPGWQRDATTQYLVGALVELLSWWVDAHKARNLEEVESFFQRLTAPVIALSKGPNSFTPPRA